MPTGYPGDEIDGRKVPRLVVQEDYSLVGVHNGGVHVEAGTFTLAGTLNGSVDLQAGTTGYVSGTLNGSLAVASGVAVVVTGSINGSLSVESGGEVIIEASGKLAGSMHNDGTVVVRGVFGGSRSGRHDLRLEDGGYIKEPTIQPDGSHCYVW